MSHHIFPVDTFSIWRNVCVQGHKSVLCSCDIESQAHNELIHCYRVRRYMLAMFIVLFPKGPGHQGAGKGHQLLQEEVQAGDEEKRVSRAVGLSKEHGQGGRVPCSAKSSCRQTSTKSDSSCRKYTAPYLAQLTSMWGGRVRHQTVCCALEEAT